MQVNAYKFLIVMLFACNFQTIMAKPKVRKSQNPVSTQEVNPIPALLDDYIKKYPCTGTLCCSANREYHEDIRLSWKASPCVACGMCQIRPVDPYNAQSYKWDGTCLDTTQSCLNIACYIPKRVTTGPALTCCIVGWYQWYLAPNHPIEYAYDQNHEIDFENRRIVRTKAQHIQRG